MSEKELVIVGCARTAFGDFLGGLKDVSAIELGLTAAKAALNRAGLKPNQVTDVVAGVVLKHGLKGNPARQVQLGVGIPEEVAAVTVDQQCASSMRALEIACQQILCGKSEIGLVVGMESMSRVPYLLPNARTGFRMGDATVYDALTYDGLHDAFLGYHMGVTAENLADIYGISREAQDKWAYVSHHRAIAAREKKECRQEITPVEIQTKKGTIIFDRDEHPKAEAKIDDLAKLKPAFKKDGTVTAGNASSLNDGAAAVVVTSMEKALELNLKPLAKILATASCGVSPDIMGIGPAYAIPLALRYAGLKKSDVDYYEINEAFAAQLLACIKVLEIPEDKVNVNGSGISMGHPVGATGLRLIIATISELNHSKKKIGVASLCAGGGPAMAVVVKAL